MKRLLALIITLCTIIALVQLPVMADETADGFEYTISNGEVTITSYIGSATNLTIPSKIDGYPVTAIGESAFYHCQNLKSIVIPNSVTSVEAWVLQECTGLTEITVDNGNPYYSSVDGILFNKDKTELICYPAGKVGSSYSIPSSVTTIGDSAFEYCNDIQSVKIPSSVTAIGEFAFSNCPKLSAITVDEGNPYFSSVNGVLFNKDKTELVCYPAGITDTIYTVPNSVTSFAIGAFAGSAFKSVTLPVGVTTIPRGAFWGCENLETIVLPNGVTTIDLGAFWWCQKLETIALPKSITYIEYAAFTECTSLSTVYYAGDEYDQKNITIYPALNEALEDAHWNYGKSLYLDMVYENSNGEVTITEYLGSATNLTIPSKIDGYPVTAIGDWVFYDCDNLKSVIISNGVTSIGTFAFCNCNSLEYVSLPDSLTTISDSAFASCTSLKSVTIPSKITTINSYAFSLCTSMESVSLPKGITSIGECAFNGCDNLTTVIYDGNKKQKGKIEIDEGNSALEDAKWERPVTKDDKDKENDKDDSSNPMLLYITLGIIGLIGIVIAALVIAIVALTKKSKKTNSQPKKDETPIEAKPQEEADSLN